ncbi:MAG: aminotransferase class I/II-fold pyridoxal phosphate-dependent enzyme, partial [Negativicutes bacterium]|nr:aminotransferase class I/II-fold pyridoxal phosphate-dependent enzyme [Negativicutes bacterium]
MDYNFDAVIRRRGSDCRKWDGMRQVFGADDLLPFWIADTDFAAPPEVLNALRAKVDHGVFGYPARPDRMLQAATGWYARRYGWQVPAEHISLCPGIVFAISLCIQALTAVGDEVIIQPPVYPPFFSCVTHNRRQLLLNPLLNDGGYYRMDFDHLATLARRPRCRLMILCSPHNPVGRAWQADELSTLSAICQQHGVTVLADEIHADLVYGRRRHIPL